MKTKNRFIQMHLLTSYPPANLNRDDLGRPKTAIMGGALRLRVSSQSLKRAWRTSDVFQEKLGDKVGTRTKKMGIEIYNKLIGHGVPQKSSVEWAKTIAQVFGKLKEKKGRDQPELHESLEIEQLAHFGPDEIQAIENLVERLSKDNKSPQSSDLELLRKRHRAADIALFGRMLASSPKYSVEAAAQVAHAISVHRVTVEDDYFTAVDDLNDGSEDAGAAHLGETEYGAGLFYLYLCIDMDLLVENLDEDVELASKSIEALLETASTVAPTGKQNSFGSRARASYIMVESGNQQPRSLSVAFLKPVYANDVLIESIRLLNETVENMDKVYGGCASERACANTTDGTGSLKELMAFATRGMKDAT